MEEREVEFLKESNAIEGEFSQEALEDAMSAWQYAKDNVQRIDLNKILKIHHLLMRRLNSDIAGSWRVNVAVRVGDRYCPAESKYFIRKKVQEWLDNCKAHTGLGAEEDIKRWHVAFEEIHPFIDGNGRVGRILMNIQRLIVNLPVLVIKDAEKQSYYQWFKKEWDIFPCQKCGAPTKNKFCPGCFGSSCKACGRNSYGKDFCAYCWGRRR